MRTSSFAPSASIAPGGDAYAHLLRDTRALRRENAHQREAWLSTLVAERKEEVLFELEVLLKGLACFANPRNHPGLPRRAQIVAQDFRDPMARAREGMARIVGLCRLLLPRRDPTFVFQRYLETMLPDDAARSRLTSGTLVQDRPEQSLSSLRHAMTNLQEVASGVTRLPRVPFRLYYAVLAVAQREIARSPFFNPLAALEFRPEFDRIANPHVLALMRGVPGDAARRLVALTFLSLFRMLRYLVLLEGTVRKGSDPAGRRAPGVAYLVMSVLRSDARALTAQLHGRAGPLLAEGYERDLLSVAAPRLAGRYDGLRAEGHRLLALKATFEGLGSNLRLEMRRAFEHDFPAPAEAPAQDALRAAAIATVHNLRPALENAILFLGRSLGVRLDEHGVFDDAVAKRTLSERLRRDVWMFGQIVRAFADKARAAPAAGGDARWSGVAPLQFVREFLAYFRAMGYPLLRAADYPHFDAFLSAMGGLEESDLLDPERLARAVGECDRFRAFLGELFTQIGQRAELEGSTFDRRAAARQLKLYLGA